jgi:hypothetical protein
MGMLNEEKDKAPRSVAEAKKQGKSTYTGKDGKQKAAVYKEDLGKGQSLKDYLNKGGGNNPSKGKNNNNKSSGNNNNNTAAPTVAKPKAKAVVQEIIQQT